MSSSFNELIKKSHFKFFLIFYMVYLIFLFLFAIPYVPEMFKPNENGESTYINPILVFGTAAFLPIILGYFITNYKIYSRPFIILNRRIMLFIIGYFLLQFVTNILLAICLLIERSNDLSLSEYVSSYALRIWVIAFSFGIFSLVLNIIIGWIWVKMDLKHPETLHWFIGLAVYFSCITISIICIQILFPSVQGILFWPFSGIIILGALNVFIVLFGLFAGAIEFLGSSTYSEVSDAVIGFYLMSIILFFGFAIFFSFFYIIAFYIGNKSANLYVKKGEKKSI